MKKTTLLLLLILSILGVQAQTIGNMPYDSIKVGRSTGLSGTNLWGRVYLPHTPVGSDSDSILTILNKRVRKVATLPISKVTGLQDSLSSKYSKNQISLTAPGVVTLSTGTGALTGGEYFVGVVPVSADGGEGSFDFIGYMLTNTITVSAAQGINAIWKTVPNAVAYRVYVGKSGYTNYKRYYETTDTSYTVAVEPAGRVGTVTITPSDSGGLLKKGYYYFAVSAVFSDGETADQTLDGNYPFAYINTDAGSVGLSWTAITGAVSYKVYVVSETDGNSRVHTKYFTTPSNSVTVLGNETYIRGLGALTKGSREHSTDNVGVFGSIYTTSNSRSQFQADIQISAVKNADAAFQANRYTNFNYAGLDIREDGSNKWRWGMGGSNDSTRNMELLRNGVGADPAIRFSHTADSIRIWWPLYSSASALFTQSSQGIGGGYGVFRNTANRTYIGVTNSSGTSFATGGVANATYLGTDNDVPVQIGVNGVVKTNTTSAGFGIGTASPQAPFHSTGKNAFSINAVIGSDSQQTSGEVEQFALGYVSGGQFAGNLLVMELQHNAPSAASSAFLRPFFRNNDNSARFTPGRMGWTKVTGENSSTWKVTTTNAGTENTGISLDKSGNLALNVTPATSAGIYKLVTRDQTTGNIEQSTILPSGTTATTQTARDSSAAVATTAYVDRIVSSGTFLPQLHGIANISAAVGATHFYERNGNIVTITGRLSITPSAFASTSTEIELEAYIPSNFTLTDDAFGIISDPGSSFGYTGATIDANPTNDRLNLTFNATSSSISIAYTIKYLVQ